MSATFFEELDIPDPDYNLGIGSDSHGAQTGRMLEAIERVMQSEKPDWVVVYGDTNSTLAGALAATKLHMRVAHVEAGLRSFNRRMPEEINRVLTDHLSNCLFAPTDTAVANLSREGLMGASVHLVGDVMYDAALRYAAKAEGTRNTLSRLRLNPKEYMLVTVHRAETTDDSNRLRALMEGLRLVADDMVVVFPLHPRTREALRRESLLGKIPAHIRLLEPVGYLDMVVLEKHARLIATDSGGVQKEAYFHRVPCITLREETEWVELVESGWNKLVPITDPSLLAKECLGSNSHPIASPDLYGGGHAAERIAKILSQSA
jgi:UDP-GlcNAc3NAcA epimerase